MIQYQKWKDEIRILITDEQNHGSVQISIPHYECRISDKADALIYALYVDSSYRRKGIATKLLQLAEYQIKLNGLQLELKELYIKFLVVTLLLVLLAWVVSVLSMVHVVLILVSGF